MKELYAYQLVVGRQSLLCKDAKTFYLHGLKSHSKHVCIFTKSIKDNAEMRVTR